MFLTTPYDRTHNNVNVMKGNENNEFDAGLAR